jgi:hypothetical protein
MKASPVIKVLQGLCVGLYAMGFAALTGLWAGEGAVLCLRASLAMLAVHALELLLARRWVALHPGPRWVSAVLTAFTVTGEPFSPIPSFTTTASMFLRLIRVFAKLPVGRAMPESFRPPPSVTWL